jgi:hypothetical protein
MVHFETLIENRRLFFIGFERTSSATQIMAFSLSYKDSKFGDFP